MKRLLDKFDEENYFIMPELESSLDENITSLSKQNSEVVGASA